MSHKERLTELRERLGVIHDFKRAGWLKLAGTSSR